MDWSVAVVVSIGLAMAAACKRGIQLAHSCGIKVRKFKLVEQKVANRQFTGHKLARKVELFLASVGSFFTNEQVMSRYTNLLHMSWNSA